jgi:hypothetical protein
VHTDHESLRWMLEARDSKIARWASRMSEFDMQIFYKKGQEMVHVDFLSRYIDADQDEDIQPRMVYNITNAPSVELPTVRDVLVAQEKSIVPIGKGYFCRDERWYFRTGLWVPPQLRIRIMAACHSLSPSCHVGAKKTKRLIQKVFNWPNLHEDIAQYIKGCLQCQQTRPGLDRLQGFFRTHPIPGPFQTIYMDYWSCNYPGQGQQTVLTMIDQFTKWAECIPIPNRLDTTVTSAFLKSWICRFGVPRAIITDNDKTFIGSLFQGIATRLGIRALRTTVYHPQGNAPIEVFHKVLQRGLAHLQLSGDTTIPFDEALQLILMGYRLTAHSTTGETPGFLTYGIDLRPAIDTDWRFTRTETERERIKFLNDMRVDIQFHAIKSIETRNRASNERRLDTKFVLNDLVLTRHTPLEQAQLIHHLGSRKLAPRWSTPCRVIRVLMDGKKAIVRNIITGKDKEIHVQDARFVALPQGDQ